MIFSDLLEQLVFPPAPVLVLIIIGLILLAFNRRRSGFSFAIAGVVLLYVASSPMVTFSLMDTLESRYSVLREVPPEAQAIVVLGAGRNRGAGDNGEDLASVPGLTRVRYAAHLHNKYGLPILATGGRFEGDVKSEAELMQEMLQSDFGITAKWLENNSRNTYENAIFSADILQKAGIEDVLVVTHAYHMERAMWCFEKAGLKPIAAPTAFQDLENQSIASRWLPYYRSVSLLGTLLHEWVGLVWYRIKYR